MVSVLSKIKYLRAQPKVHDPLTVSKTFQIDLALEGGLIIDPVIL